MSDVTPPGEAGLPALAPGTVVAVTGATGFIGGRLVEMLARSGCHVTCLIRGGQAPGRLHRAGAHIRTLDLADPDAVRDALQGTAVVFHLAYDWGSTEWNFAALRALIEACRASACRLVHVSSFVVYDIPDQGAVTEDSPPTRSTQGYAHTKLALEAELLRAVRERGVPATILQPTIVYGPFSKPWTIDPADMLRHGTVVLPDAGAGICNAVYVDDVVGALLLAAEMPAAIGRRYLVSGPAPITWAQFYEGMAHAIGAPGPQYRPAGEIARGHGKSGTLQRLAADPELLVRRVAAIGPARKLLQIGLKVLSGGARHGVQDRLFGPATQRRGHRHLPDAGHLGFLQGRSTIAATRARHELGYAPAFDFAAGMVPTGQYLTETYFKAA